MSYLTSAYTVGIGVGCGVGVGFGGPVSLGQCSSGRFATRVLLLSGLSILITACSSTPCLSDAYAKTLNPTDTALMSSCKCFPGATRGQPVVWFSHCHSTVRYGTSSCLVVAGALPVLGQASQGIQAGLSSLTAALAGAGTTARAAVRGLGITGLDAGFGCGVGIGYGFGAGLMLKPSAAEHLMRAGSTLLSERVHCNMLLAFIQKWLHLQILPMKQVLPLMQAVPVLSWRCQLHLGTGTSPGSCNCKALVSMQHANALTETGTLLTSRGLGWRYPNACRASRQQGQLHWPTVWLSLHNCRAPHLQQ